MLHDIPPVGFADKAGKLCSAAVVPRKKDATDVVQGEEVAVDVVQCEEDASCSPQTHLPRVRSLSGCRPIAPSPVGVPSTRPCDE